MAHLFGKKERIYDQRKQNFKITLEKLLANFSRMFVVELDNVTSNQMHQVSAAATSTPPIFVSYSRPGPHVHAWQGRNVRWQEHHGSLCD
jgi:hypothetical protein